MQSALPTLCVLTLIDEGLAMQYAVKFEASIDFADLAGLLTHLNMKHSTHAVLQGTNTECGVLQLPHSTATGIMCSYTHTVPFLSTHHCEFVSCS